MKEELRQADIPGTQTFLPLKLGIFEIPQDAPLNFSRNIS